MPLSAPIVRLGTSLSGKVSALIFEKVSVLAISGKIDFMHGTRSVDTSVFGVQYLGKWMFVALPRGPGGFVNREEAMRGDEGTRGSHPKMPVRVDEAVQSPVDFSLDRKQDVPRRRSHPRAKGLVSLIHVQGTSVTPQPGWIREGQ